VPSSYKVKYTLYRVLSVCSKTGVSSNHLTLSAHIACSILVRMHYARRLPEPFWGKARHQHVPSAGERGRTAGACQTDFLARGGDQYPLSDLEFINVRITYQQMLAGYLTGPLAGSISESAFPVGGEGPAVCVNDSLEAHGKEGVDFSC
jgi:hypothetical protein